MDQRLGIHRHLSVGRLRRCHLHKTRHRCSRRSMADLDHVRPIRQNMTVCTSLTISLRCSSHWKYKATTNTRTKEAQIQHTTNSTEWIATWIISHLYTSSHRIVHPWHLITWVRMLTTQLVDLQDSTVKTQPYDIQRMNQWTQCYLHFSANILLQRSSIKRW